MHHTHNYRNKLKRMQKKYS